jgi:cyclophilin family peptidyl-prolyl cis-trans isomerase
MANIMQLIPFFLLLLLSDIHLTHAEEQQEVSLTVRNELPEPVLFYWDGVDEQDPARVPQNDDEPIAAKGGELKIRTFPGHRFSYDYGGETHYVMVSSKEEESYQVLLAGNHEIGVRCTVTSNAKEDINLPLNIRVLPWWSPGGASRFLSLVRNGHYNGVALNRVVPNFLTQFGISPDYEARTRMRTNRIKDDYVHDPPIPFIQGSMAFAGSGPDSRTTEVFIVATGTTQMQLNHFGANPWETPFALIDDVQNTPVQNWYSYGDMPPWGEGPDSQKIYLEDGYEYLERDFPKLDYIEECVVQEITLKEEIAEEL